MRPPAPRLPVVRLPRLAGMVAWGLAAITAAAAARPALAGDLPAGRSRPLFMAACPDAGDGFVRIPGTETCIAVGGSVEFDVTGASPIISSLLPAFTTTILPQFAIDTVTQTENGPLRAFMRVTFSQSSPGNETTPSPDYIFVSLGEKEEGMAQAGLTDSSFSFYASAVNILTLRGPNVSSNQLRYAALPEAGFGWSVSMESDPANVRNTFLDPAFQTILAPGAQAAPRLPNVDGLAQWAWEGGTVAVAGTAGQVRLSNPNASLPRFALLLGVTLNLTGALDGDTVWLQAVGSSADTTYLGFGSSIINGRLAAAVVDAVVTPTGEAKPTRGAAVTAAWSHVINDDWTLGAFGSWATVNPASAAGIRPYVAPFTEWRLGANLAWNPVEQLTITGEVQWVSLRTRSTLVPSLDPLRPTRQSETWLMALQVKRDF